MDCVLILFQRKLHPVIADSAAPCPKPSWAESLKVRMFNVLTLPKLNRKNYEIKNYF